MSRNDRTRYTLFAVVVVGIGVAMVASAAHAAEALAWANDGPMPLFLAGVLVILEVVFVALATLTPAGRTRIAVLAGMGLLQAVALSANFAQGALRVRTRMPAEVPGIFGLSEATAQTAAAFLFAGAIPLLVAIAAFAVAETSKALLVEPPIDPNAERLLEAFEREFTSDQHTTRQT